MIRKTILTTLAAAALSAAAMGASATTASAGIKIFLGGGFYGHGYGYNTGYVYGGSYRKCRLKRKHIRVWSNYYYRYVTKVIYVKKCRRIYY